jgi:undecaprenyl-diphosphatase
MNIFEAILLGFIQGITEFIPVSSSGHLEIAQHLLNIQSSDNFHLFLEFINLGTLLALLIYFRKRIWRIIKDVFQNRNYKLAINIVVTTIPAGLAGILLSDFIENNGFFSSLITVSIAMGVVGLIMMFIDHIPHMSELKNENHLTPSRALIIGLSQIFALIPGTSRSGTTIITGRIVGLDSESSAEYSFLASIPIMCGVCLKMFLSSTGRTYFAENIGILTLSNLVAFIVGLFALHYLLRYLKKPHTLQTFGRYRVIVSCLVLGTILILM